MATVPISQSIPVFGFLYFTEEMNFNLVGTGITTLGEWVGVEVAAGNCTLANRMKDGFASKFLLA